METTNLLLNKKIKFGSLKNFKNKYDEYISSFDKRELLKDDNFYDLIFVIILIELFKNKKFKILGGKKEDVIFFLRETIEELNKDKSLIILEKNGFIDNDFKISNDEKIKELKQEIMILSIKRILRIVDFYFDRTEIKSNEDSVFRYLDLFDLVVFNKKYIDFKELDFSLLKINNLNYFKLILLTTKEKR